MHLIEAKARARGIIEEPKSTAAPEAFDKYNLLFPPPPVAPLDRRLQFHRWVVRPFILAPLVPVCLATAFALTSVGSRIAYV